MIQMFYARIQKKYEIAAPYDAMTFEELSGIFPT
jgi:hypothetical protein